MKPIRIHRTPKVRPVMPHVPKVKMPHVMGPKVSKIHIPGIGRGMGMRRGRI